MSDPSAVTAWISPRPAPEPAIAGPIKHCQFDLRCQLDNRAARDKTGISEWPRGPIVVARKIEQRSVRRAVCEPGIGCKSDHSRPSIGRQFVYFQRRVKCVIDDDGNCED
jgi:hypothetical protein